MKRVTLLFFVALMFGSFATAQDSGHGEFGVYGEYFRFQALKANMVGLGGRLSVNVMPKWQIEAEMGYLFKRGFIETFNNGIPNGASLSNSNLRVLHGMAGPKYQFNRGPARPFVTLKGGFFNTEINGQPPGPGFTSQINNLRTTNTHAVVYPGAGLEGYLGPIGIRFDIGDEIFFTGGKLNHNLRMSIGPHIRF